MKIDVDAFVRWASEETECRPGHGNEKDMLWVIANALTVIADELHEIIKTKEVKE